MPDPQESPEMQAAEIGKKMEDTGEDLGSLILIKEPDQLQPASSLLPYSTSFTNLIRYLNVVKDHLAFVKENEVPLPRGNFLYITPPGEDIKRCITFLAHQFYAKFIEILTSRILSENVVSSQHFVEALELGSGEPHSWASIVYVPSFGELVMGLQDPVQEHLLSQILGQNHVKDPPTILIAEIHDIQHLPQKITCQFDFIESIPPLSHEEATSFLREIVKFELPWDSPDLLSAPFWLNQLYKVGTRLNLLNLGNSPKQRKLTEKDVAKIIRELGIINQTPIDFGENPAKFRMLPNDTNTNLPFPKNTTFGDQILQDLASRQFSLASGILDKLLQGTPINALTEIERMLLVDYGILLSEDPAKLKIRLLNAKKRVDSIQNVFKKG
ncbi:MAG: hypothetical protein RBG13Loki_0689 [Promethearchaeota archaeon CR_4]|nr:MAG: hypothetical protein RBG13Loki_0689 [Candidatus Lokiarchaeota archaeon CR_4]